MRKSVLGSAPQPCSKDQRGRTTEAGYFRKISTIFSSAFTAARHPEDSQGVGLGLPLARSIIEGQGGTSCLWRAHRERGQNLPSRFLTAETVHGNEDLTETVRKEGVRIHLTVRQDCILSIQIEGWPIAKKEENQPWKY